MICFSAFCSWSEFPSAAFRRTIDMKRYIEVTNTISKLFALSIGLGVLVTLSCATCFAQETGNGAISTVRISPDLRQIVVRAEGILGRHTAFAFDKPYRLVVDFESTSLGKVPSRIKLEKPPISEIRLGKLENRARLVIDFGDNPVPSYAIERQDNMAVIALGESAQIKAQNHSEAIHDQEPKPQKRSVVNSKPVPLKKEQNQTIEQVPAPAPIKNVASLPANQNRSAPVQPQQAIKKAVLSNDLLLVEFQDPANPGQTFNLAIDIDLKDHTLKGASLSGLNGEIKRFEISEYTDQNDYSGTKHPAAAPQSAGPRKVGASNTVFDTKPMEKPRNVFNSVPSVTSIQPPETQTVQNPLKMEEFKLQVKKDL